MKHMEGCTILFKYAVSRHLEIKPTQTLFAHTLELSILCILPVSAPHAPLSRSTKKLQRYNVAYHTSKYALVNIKHCHKNV
jgi:hypothetical protein